MLDYIRNTNLYDGLLSPNNRYNSTAIAHGQVTPVCLCGGTADHAATWMRSTQPAPRGIGRLVTVSEVALVFSCRTVQQPNGPVIPDVTDSAYNLAHVDRIPGNLNLEVEVGVLIEAFVAGHGWGEYRPNAAFQLIGGVGQRVATQQGPTTPDGTRIASMSVNGKQLVYGRQGDARQTQALGGSLGTGQTPTDGSLPSQFVAWGGNLGVRYQSNMITFRPIMVSAPPGQPPILNFSGSTSNSEAHPRLIIFDNTGAALDITANATLDVNQLVQVIPLPFPPIRQFRIPQNPGPKNRTALDDRLRLSRTNGQVFGDEGIVRRGDIVQSLVPVHGDFRMLSMKRVWINGREPSDSAADTPFRYPIMVPHPLYGVSPMAHNLREPLLDLDKQLAAAPGSYRGDNTGYFEDANDTRNMNFEPEYLPDFPIKPWGNRSIRLLLDLSGTDSETAP